MPVGESIDQAVANQIARREAVYGKEYRDTNDLKYLNSREGWVKVISFVKEGGNTEIAKSLVLGGAPGRYSDAPIIQSDGTFATVPVRDGEFGPEDIREQGYYTPGGIDFRGRSGRFYNFSTSTGVRPMPGLTGFSVKSKNTYGTLREAQISFVVWSKEDLDLVEKLYFRLGFEVLIEWGHTYYLNNSGELREPVFEDYEKFFQRSTVQEILALNHVKGKRRDSSFNQEGMLGYIKNFSWTFREDGGYDCSISVISTGEVIESLTMKLGSKLNTEGKEYDGIFRFRRSDFHALSFLTIGKLDKLRANEITNTEARNVTKIEPGLVTFEDIDYYSDRIVFLGGGKIDLSLGKKIKEALGLEDSDNIAYVDKVRVEESKYLPDFLFPSEDKVLRYIPLRVFLAMVNMIAERQGSSTLFDLTPGEKYLYFREQTSIAPYVAVLPQNTHFDIGSVSFTNVVRASSSFKNYENSDQDKAFEILSIMVNLDMIVGKVDQRLESDDEGDIRSFVKSVLSEINRAVANTIDLDITFDDDTGLHRVIDRKNLPITGTEVTTIAGTGTKTTFSSLSINSKVTNKLGAQISIAAQAEPTSYRDVAKFTEWNENLTSKIIRRNVTETTTGTDQTPEQKKDFRLLLREAYKVLNEATVSGSNSTALDVDMFAEVTSLGKKYYDEILEKEEALPKGLIPIELSFKMDGIGGLKIGQSFKLSSRRLLPARYNNERFAFIVTGLEHSFENQRWYTQVTAQTFLLRR